MTLRAGLALAVALGLWTGAVGACSADHADDGAALVDELIDSVEPTASFVDPSDSSQLAGTSTSPSRIEAGQCFNEYLFRDRSDFVQQVTTIVGCDGPHDREAYHRTEFPGGETASYPLGDDLERWADTTCLDEFEDFVGLEYVLSRLEIGAIVPTFEAWTAEGDRAVICYVFPDEGGRLLASVRGSGI